ncbi:hypothetical protein [Rhodococcus sp. BH5]|uniref:hypothetical protein n=1 Tax=Rhodococcus sp. BH5 TaxID=2871702 RepID=UPI0022CD5E86|nr:hypothetical protein [Rhodococcus sp. BH5]MCZ9635175.1 hypothetical protein [Rhodococcus sp. BH5]
MKTIALAHTVSGIAQSAYVPVHQSTATYLAQPNTNGLTDWIRGNSAVTLMAVIACAILLGALKGNVSKVVTIGGLSVVGLLFVGFAANEGAQDALGKWALGLFGV